MNFYNNLSEVNLYLEYELDENCSLHNCNIDCATQAEFCINEFGQITYTNNAMSCLSGYSCQELLNMTLFDVDYLLLSHEWIELWKTLKNNGSIKLVSQYRTKAGQSITVSVSMWYIKQNFIDFACAFVTYMVLH